MLRIDNLTYRIGPRVLLNDTSVAINAGHRVGLVGRNGTGKTTLLKLITGALSVDGGTISYPPRWTVGITSQEAPGGSDSLIDTVLKADAELVALTAEAETAHDPERIGAIHARLHDKDAYTARARAARILAGLGFDDAAQQKPCSDYSGGWRMRVALAGLLFTQPDLLLLDEPTNHLDLEATIWLEDYLRSYPGTILLVSHDRGLLNRVPEEILHLENGKMTLYQGGYDRFENTRRMQLELNEKLRAKQELRRAEIQKFIDRFKAKASKAKQAQSRVKMLQRMQPIAQHHEEAGVEFNFPEPDELAPPLYSINRVTLGYDGKPVLSQLSLRLDTDDRIALLGANGNGKSTFVKLLAGKLAPMSGDVSRSSKLRVGYFAQHQTDELDLNATPILEMSRRRPKDTEQQIRNHLGQFNFSKQRAETKIANLSGGEKARLLFALMTVAKPHILLLDEPTNHLDMDSRQALVEAINNFPGAVIIISHDPHVLELTVDRFWLVDGGKITPFEGDMDDYRDLLLGRAGKTQQKAPAAPEPTAAKKDNRRAAADRRNALKPLRTQIERAETKVAKLTAERTKLTESLTDPKLYEGPPTALIEIQTRLGYLDNEIAEAEAAWLTLQDEWERAHSDAAA
ncbi:MAG: ABC-F family ATP-binding cassette domain-containing protein [Rhodospirillaceae bacterium]|nr:ABC-F family ATP-binding cassette domain-containing protein [Rhodospirillaceae bacterium]